MIELAAALAILLKAVFYCVAFLGVGQILLRVSLGVAMRGIGWLAVSGAALSVGAFAIQGAVLSGNLAGMADLVMLEILWMSPQGDTLLLRIAGFGGLLLVAYRPALWPLGLVACLAILWSFASLGHLSEASLSLQLGLALHLACVGWWLAILLPLHRSSAREAADLGHRFARQAIVLVPLLLSLGVWMAFHLVGGLSGMFTIYGLTLSAKVALVAGLLGIAALNKLRLVPLAAQGNAGPLRTSLRFEMLLFALIFLATATLTTLFGPPA